MNNESVWPTVLGILVALLLVVNIGVVYSASQKDLVVPTADEIAAKVVVPAAYNDTALVNKVDALSNEVSTDDEETVALNLVLDELKTKDFKRELRSFLNAELNASGSTSTVEDYKDVVSVVVKDSDVVVSGTDASVELELKVGYFLDGDDDESDKEYAKVTVELSVSDLDSDDKYVDAETDSYSTSDFHLVKFFLNN